ncbi:MAG: Elongation factor P--(R)-beta-lysine ligase [Legionellaceae bacterium]
MVHWQPTATIENLKQRAQIIQKIRQFFAQRHVMEVETPLLSAGTVTDPYLNSMSTEYKEEGQQQSQTFYLQTSPEFAMKRLLAADSGPIYQLCKSFRNGEAGRFHNPEFTMLEWYRPNFDHHALMTEMDEFLQAILGSYPAERLSYEAIFEKYLETNPHQVNVDELKNCAQQHCIDFSPTLEQVNDKDTWLFLLMTHVIEPQLGQLQPTFIYDFPASQAALARIRQDVFPVAERFEVYVKGIELANGFHELSDANEQALRFQKDLAKRHTLGYPFVNIDHYLLAALEAGFPNCAGVALGIDRLIMLALNAQHISDVVSFTIHNA